MSALQRAPLPRANLEAAADWWTRLQDVEVPAEAVTAWLEWMEADPRHRDAYQRIQDLTLRLGAGEQTTARRGVAWKRVLPIAAGVAALAIGVGIALTRFGTASPALELSTPIAAVEQVPLPDGSRVSLGGATAVDAVYTPASRDLRLKEGEAYFEVRPEGARRPFVVSAGKVSIQALGTAFNVRKTRDRVTVTVTEGKIQVTRNEDGKLFPSNKTHSGGVEAGAGEQVTFDPETDRFRVSAVDARRALTWREQRLEFIDEPLDVVIANINRHSRRQIEVRAAGLHGHFYTGTFSPDTLDEWLIAVERAFPVRIDARGSVVIVE